MALQARLDADGEDAAPAGQALADVFAKVAKDGSINGVDIFVWSRAARAYRSEVLSENPGGQRSGRFQRGLLAMQFLLGLIAITSVLLFFYFVGYGFSSRRWSGARPGLHHGPARGRGRRPA